MSAHTVPDAVRKRLLRFLHARPDGNADMDELNSVFLQIVLAVMLVFMIAFFLFMNRVGGEISRIDQLKAKAAQADKERIRQAVEKTAESYRIRYGLKEFLRIDPLTGTKEYEFSGVLVKGKISGKTPAGRACRIGWKRAKQDYADLPALEKSWLVLVDRVAPESGKTPLAAAAVHDAVLRLKHEIAEVQLLCAASLQEQLASHPEQVEDPVIRKLIRKISKDPASAAGNQADMTELNRRLKRYVYDMIARQSGSGMLEE